MLPCFYNRSPPPQVMLTSSSLGWYMNMMNEVVSHSSLAYVSRVRQTWVYSWTLRSTRSVTLHQSVTPVLESFSQECWEDKTRPCLYVLSTLVAHHRCSVNVICVVGSGWERTPGDNNLASTSILLPGDSKQLCLQKKRNTFRVYF